MTSKICENCTRYGINCNGADDDRRPACAFMVDSRKYPRYVLRDGYIGTFYNLEPGIDCKIPVYTFPGGRSMVSDRELLTGSNDRETLKEIDVSALPVLSFSNAAVGGLYQFCGGWQKLIRVYSITEEQAAEDHLCYLDRYYSIDSHGVTHDAAFPDGRISHGIARKEIEKRSWER